jgi:rRNA-processing protein EBP2
MAGQKTKITSKKSHLRPSMGKSIKGGTKEAEAIEPALSNDESESDTSETEDNNEEGLEKLMKALGEDGLNEFDLAQLQTLTGTAASDEEGDDEEDEGSSEETGDEEQGSSGGEEIALDDEDVDSVDEDAVPRRKIAMDNKVRRSLPFTRYFI